MKSCVKYSTLLKFMRSARNACTKGFLHNNAHDEKFTSLAAAPGDFCLIPAALWLRKKGERVAPCPKPYPTTFNLCPNESFPSLLRALAFKYNYSPSSFNFQKLPPPLRTMHRIFVDFLMVLSHSVAQKCPIREPPDSWGWNWISAPLSHCHRGSRNFVAPFPLSTVDLSVDLMGQILGYAMCAYTIVVWRWRFWFFGGCSPDKESVCSTNFAEIRG